MLLSVTTRIMKKLSLLLYFFACEAFAATDQVLKEAGGKGGDPVSSANLLQLVVGLAVVIGLIFALSWFFRRYGNFTSVNRNDFRVIAGLSMGQRERVVMLQVGSHQVLIGVAPGRVERLHVFDTPVLHNEAVAGPDSFAARLASVIKQKAQD